MTATYSRTAGETVAGSPYTISAALAPAGVLSNYAITYNTGAFTITPKAASVTPDAATQDLRRGDPALTGTLGGFLAADGVTATYSRDGGRDGGGQPVHRSARCWPGRRCWATTTSPTTRPASRSREGGVGDAERGEQDLRRRRPGVDRHADRLPGGGRRDRDLQPHGRRDGGGQPVHRSARRWPGRRCWATTPSPTTRRNFTITAKAASVTPDAASKIYGAADPALTGTLSGFLAADGVTATYSRTAGETVAGSPYAISAALARRRAGQLQHHLQHGRLHDHREGGVGDAERGEQDLRRRPTRR